MKTKIIVSLIFFLLVYSCKEKDELNRVQNKEKIKSQIERTIRNAIGWVKTKDINLLYNTVANDSNYLEVHPGDNIVKGFDEFRKMEKFWLNPDFKAVGYNISDLHINLSNCGTVAWFYCILDDLNEWKGQPANWENTRWTGVLEFRDDKWRIVQMHFSFACNN